VKTEGVRIAIHPRQGSFSDRWIERCEAAGIDHVIVDGYSSAIMDALRGCDAFFWHFNHDNPTDLLMARHVLYAAESAGLLIFPNRKTCWHFDDKVAQKYLLEAVDAPLIPTVVFYEKRTALGWLSGAQYPVVCKLRAGAHAANVRLLRNVSEARRFCRRAFGRGLSAVPGYFTDVPSKARSVKDFSDFRARMGRLPRLFLHRMRTRRRANRERGYVLFQEFIPDNRYDTRVTVIGDRAWAFIRRVRKNDFRASGSRQIDHDPDKIDARCVRIAFETAGKLGTQCTAFDFVTCSRRGPLIVEMSYGFAPRPVFDVPGQWSPDLQWHAGHVWPQDAILELLLRNLTSRHAST